MTKPFDSAQKLSDSIDSDILLSLLREGGKVFDDQKVPLIGRYFYNPETDKVEAVDS
jgi:hypothetical protein